MEFLEKCSYCEKGKNCIEFFTCDKKLFLLRLSEQHNILLNDTYSMLSVLSDNITNMSYDSYIHAENKKLLSYRISRFIDASAKTFADIALLANNYSFANVFALMRKLRDDLLLILYIIKIRLEVTNKEIKQLSSDKDFDAYISTKEEKIVAAFFDNTIINDSGNSKYIKDFKAEAFLKNLRENLDLEKCFNKFFEKDKQKVFRFLDNHMHSNGVGFSTASSKFQDQKTTDIYMRNLSFVLKYILNLFLSFIILLQPNVIMASDYIDSLDCGVTPENNSQYWVASAIQDFITKYMKKELRTYLKENNKYEMEIDDED